MFEIIKNGYCIIKLHISWINSYNVRVFKKSEMYDSTYSY